MEICGYAPVPYFLSNISMTSHSHLHLRILRYLRIMMQHLHLKSLIYYCATTLLISEVSAQINVRHSLIQSWRTQLWCCIKFPMYLYLYRSINTTALSGIMGLLADIPLQNHVYINVLFNSETLCSSPNFNTQTHIRHPPPLSADVGWPKKIVRISDVGRRRLSMKSKRLSASALPWLM